MKKTLSFQHFFYTVIIGFCCLVSPGTAAADPQTPNQTIQSFLETVRAMEFPVTNPARHSELVKEANAYLDVESMGSQALAEHWSGISSDERKDFIGLLWKLVETVAYPRNQNLISNEQIIYGEPVQDKNGFQIPVTLKRADDAPTVSMSYHLSEKEGRWKIDDVVLDDVSIIEDLKYQFDKITAESEFSGLLEKMRQRLAEAEEKQK